MVLALCGAPPGGDGSSAVEESQKAAGLMGVELRVNDLQPGRLEDDAAIEEMVRQALEEMRPSVVYTRSATDGDADRRAVHPPAMSAAWNVPDVSCFQSRTAAEYWGRFATFGLVEPLEVVRATR